MQRSVGAGRFTAKHHGGKTRIADLYQKANAKIRIPKSYDDTLEAVLINTSGGMTGGDELLWDIQAQEGAKIQITTQACEKIYRSTDGPAQIKTHIKAADNSLVEWLPQETILFDEGQLNRTIDIDLAPSASFIGLEAVVLGRTAMGEKARTIHFKDQWRIKRDGKLIHADNLVLDGDIENHIAKTPTLNGHCAFASLAVCLPPAQEDAMALLADKIRKNFHTHPQFAINHLPQKLIARFVNDDMYDLRKQLIDVLTILRDNRDLPKVWRL